MQPTEKTNLNTAEILHYERKMDEKKIKDKTDVKWSFGGLIEDRDEIELFRSYLTVFDPEGLQFLQLWLTLRGYEKEYAGRRANSAKSDFIKWNIKCAKALIDKYFNETRNVQRPAQVQNFEHEVQLRIEQTKATPTLENTHALKTTLTNLLAILQRILECVQFKSFATHRQMAHEQTQKAKYMPKVPENEIVQVCSSPSLSSIPPLQAPNCSNRDSENASFSDTTTESFSTKTTKHKEQMKQVARNRSGLANFVRPRREVDFVESDLATRNPKVFAAKLIQRLQLFVQSQPNQKSSPPSRSIVLAPKCHQRPHSKLRPAQRTLQDFDSKVGDWLERNHNSSPTLRKLTEQSTCLEAEVRVLSTMPKSTAVSTTSGAHRPQPNMSSHHARPSGNAIGSSVLSSDSGLSSIRIESEVTDSEIIEMAGVKRLLIEDIEKGDHAHADHAVASFTRVIYNYQSEKFIVRVDGTEPTLGAFRTRFHEQQPTHALRFFFKQPKTDKWHEMTHDGAKLPVENELVQAKVVCNPTV